MSHIKLPFFLLFFLALTSYYSSCQQQSKGTYLLLINDSITNQYGYRDQTGKLVIPFGKYPMAFTDTFRTNAIVLKPGEGFVAIGRKEKVLYHIYPFDNGPDYPVEGLYRIIENGKIGYADLNGHIVIAPQFTCAYPFDNGKAKVSTHCTSHQDGEHSYWESNEWYFIDKKGKRL